MPRQLFGQSKKGSAVIFSMPSIPYGKTLPREFFDYLAANNVMRRSTTWLADRSMGEFHPDVEARRSFSRRSLYGASHFQGEWASSSECGSILMGHYIVFVRIKQRRPISNTFLRRSLSMLRRPLLKTNEVAKLLYKKLRGHLGTASIGSI